MGLQGLELVQHPEAFIIIFLILPVNKRHEKGAYLFDEEGLGC